MEASEKDLTYVQWRIIDALLGLMAEIPYDKITVSMIARRGRLHASRSTATSTERMTCCAGTPSV